MVVTEAFAHGLPVITTRRAGAADLVRHGENGLIIPAGDASLLQRRWSGASPSGRIEGDAQGSPGDRGAWQWSDFRQALARNVVDGLRGGTPRERDTIGTRQLEAR